MNQSVNFSLPSLPLSQIQQINWFLHQLSPQGFADKVSVAIRIKSSVDIDAIKIAFESLIERHPILRSKYSKDRQGNLFQELNENWNFLISEIDFVPENLKELNQQILQLIQSPFCLEDPPLIRVNLLNYSALEHILLITAHQIVSDRESLLILVDEFLTILTNKNAILPKLNQSYVDYIQAEINLVKSSESAKIVNYWKNNLSGELPILNFPSKLARQTIRTFNGLSHKFIINDNLTQQIKDLAKTNGVTLKTIILAAFEVLLYRYTGEEDILVGLCQSNKQQPDYSQVIGNFSNVIVARNSLVHNPFFLDFVKQVNQQESEIKQYNCPFTWLLKKLQFSSNLSHAPICQAAFDYYNFSSLKNISNLFDSLVKNQSITCGNLELEYLEISEERVDFDLTLEIIELTDALLVFFKYNKDLLESETVAQVAKHFQNLLQAIVADSKQSVAQIPLLTEPEKNQLIFDWNKTQTKFDFSHCLPELFAVQVEKTPDTIAVIFEENKLTYKELNNRANQLANYLQKIGVKAEVLVGICIERSLEMIIGLLGILKAGGAYVPIDPEYPPERREYMLSDSQVSVLLTQSKLLIQLPKNQAQVICLDTDWALINQENQNNFNSNITYSNLAYIIYTSGSTGQPKGVEICHQSLTNFLNTMKSSPGITKQDILLAVTSISFDIAALEIYLPLIVGAQVVLVSREVAANGWQLLEKLHNSQATIMQATPATWNLILAAGWQSSPQLKILCGGEALTRKLANQLLEKGASVWNLYGPTETTIWSSIYPVNSYHQLFVNKETVESIGRPIANTQIYILDRYLQPVPIGVIGELHIGGVGLARGYLNRPELTEEKFIFSPLGRLYKTGDLACYLPDRNIEYIGRIDHQVKIRGFRIELGEIENVLIKHPEVQQAVVIARSEKSDEKQLVAYILPKFKKDIVPQLRLFLKQKLPSYMMPGAIVVLDSFPITPNGKINRRALPTPDQWSFTRGNFSPPRNNIESQLIAIWSKLLNFQQVGIKDNFFDLGGHSILAVQLMSKIQQEFGKNLPMKALFPSATIEELAEYISGETDTFTKYNHPCIVPIQPKGNNPPFFAVHPAFGHVLCYSNLSRHLGNEQPFYGLQAIGFNEGEKPLEKLEDMANLYIEAIKEVQPQGPYQIGGWSFGGVVAFEIAQQLQKQGETISCLAILDSYVPILLDSNKKIDDVYLVGVLSRLFGGIYGQDNLVTSEELAGLSIDEQINYITTKAKEAKIFPAELEGKNNRKIVDVLVGTLKATYSYKRQPYSGKVTIFRAKEKHIMSPDPTLVWVELFAVLAAKEIEIINVSGNHYTLVLEPNVTSLAKHLGQYLA